MRILKHIGWVVLSTLCFFIVLFFVQWLTFEVADLRLITNHVLLFLFAGLIGLALPKWYGPTGAFVLSMIMFVLMASANNLTFELYNFLGLLVIASFAGTFIRQKKRIGWIVCLLIGGLVLLNAYQKYSTITLVEVSKNQKTDATRFNAISKDFVSMKGQRLRLSEDTVYLVNFTFHACKPCRNKQPSLQLLEKEFTHQPFKLVTVHCVDSMDVFKKYYSDYANCFHNTDPKLEQKLSIPSYPYEIIFDKKGHEVRRFNGFSMDSKNDYLNKTSALIKKLIHEN